MVTPILDGSVKIFEELGFPSDRWLVCKLAFGSKDNSSNSRKGLHVLIVGNI